MTKTANPFEVINGGQQDDEILPSEPETPEEKEERELDEEIRLRDGQLGDAARAAIGHTGEPTQDPLEGTEFLKVKFVGMAIDSLEEQIPLGEERTFIVKARCNGQSVELMENGTERRTARMKVSSVKEQDAVDE
jgi:hypothetical protein